MSYACLAGGVLRSKTYCIPEMNDHVYLCSNYEYIADAFVFVMTKYKTATTFLCSKVA